MRSTKPSRNQKARSKPAQSTTARSPRGPVPAPEQDTFPAAVQDQPVKRTRPQRRNPFPPAAGFGDVFAVSEVTGLGVSTIWRRAAQGTFPAPVKLGLNLTRFSWAAVLQWIDEQAARAKSDPVPPKQIRRGQGASA